MPKARKFLNCTFHSLPSRNKSVCNDNYTILIEENGLTDGNHFFLESGELLTVRTLKGNEIEKHQMYTANFTESVCNTLKKEFLEKNIYYGKCNEYFENSETKFCSMWLDYCGTAYGNVSKGLSPVDDLITILQRELIENYGIIGFTFSIRCAKDGRKKRNRRFRLQGWEKMLNKDHINYPCYKRLVKFLDAKTNKRNIEEIIKFCNEAFKNFNNYNFEVIDYYPYEKEIGREIMYTYFIQVKKK
jgi:hypothetical protein